MPDLQPLLAALRDVEPLRIAGDRLRKGERLSLGVGDAAKSVVAAALWERLGVPLLLVVPREADAEAAVEALRVWAGDAVRHFPARGGLPYAREATPAEITRRRIAVLSVLARAGTTKAAPPLIVASAAAVAGATARPGDLGRGPGRIAVGGRMTVDDLADALVEAGYTFEALVDGPGQAARRGGLLDLFPPSAETPLRIEFFGDEVDSIRRFDPQSQRTIERIEQIEVGPASEWFPSRSALSELAAQMAGVTGEAAEDELAGLRRGVLPAPDRYGPLASDATLLDHLPAKALLLVDEDEAVLAAAAEQDELTEERAELLAGEGDLPSRAPRPHLSEQALIRVLDRHLPRADLARWATGAEADALRIPFGTHDAFAGRLEAAVSDFGRKLARGDCLVVVTQQAQRFREVLREHGLDTTVRDGLDAPPQRGELALVQGALSEGWRIATPGGEVALATDRELFGFVKKRRALRRATTHRSRFLAEVAPGDFVVHSDHGIARFAGLVRRNVGEEQRDYLQLNYASDDRLYVPIEQIDRVTRYVANSDHVPRLTRLGTQEWSRARARVRAAVGELAADLLRLYAARQLLRGHAFAADGEWQREMEAAFAYEETEDQLRAIAEVKADMESKRPMDRIVLGDVGFGKTEVAVRAAFKAAQDGYQVAVLVPTTVLAQQHERTFRERLAAFPVVIEVLSRFRTDQEAAAVVEGLRDGSIDIVIGTHRLLHAGVEFSNLGLVIIDEEQRFGVAHKERLKRMRLEVDVLALSATPIPRTLHMSLAGIRDMSTMETAPEDRQPVQTFVAEWDGALVREAILAEVDRGGQVYVVHNRVHSIDDFAARLRELAPEARIAVGHGRMPKVALRGVMERFAEHEADVLVCTTIIESGIDIPNVNTLIIDHADRLGLAQLYQLRGRVGRGPQQARAYLLHGRDRILTEQAQRRLATIFEAVELGAGFQVALRDLEIRGAGNLLGAEQSGQIATVGFDLYTQMLAEAVERLRGASDGVDGVDAPAVAGVEVLVRELPMVAIDLPVSAFIPESYVEDLEARIALYQRISALRSFGECDELVAEVVDRFGEVPRALDDLIALVRVRLAAVEARVASIRVEGGEVVVTAREGTPFASRRLPALPRGVEVGRMQLRLDRAALGERDLSAIEALLRLVADAEGVVAEPVGARR